MRLVANRNYSQRVSLAARARQSARLATTFVISKFLSVWNQAFPMPPSDGPDTSPTMAKAAALQEGALLSEDLEATAKKHIA